MGKDQRNLKGNKDHLEYFRIVNTGVLLPRKKTIHNQNNNNQITKDYYYPDYDKVKFTESEVRKFSLDTYGENIPYTDGELTIFNNYLFDFWGYYLNAEGLALYGHLKRFAYGTKDWCFPNFELISLKMDKSRPTIHTYMDILERYGFSYKFNVINHTRAGTEESPIFKIRKKVPLLTKALIYGNKDLDIPNDAAPHIKKALKKEQKGLPERLRKEHEKYINMNERIEIQEDIDFEEIYKRWHEYGEIIKTSKKVSIKKISESKVERSMDEPEEKLLKFVKSYVSKKISKPSYDTWFREVSLKAGSSSITIISPDEFAKEWLERKYFQLIQEALNKFGIEFENILFDTHMKNNYPQ
ncbi:DnaA N-terminal domain-containing protein [Cytobacillus firmus]|uniref:DnaA N-terminal domain-containing protein n=1 Tax=Cytobacillus firmus TaxID=1399 RepID=UPI003001911B